MEFTNITNINFDEDNNSNRSFENKDGESVTDPLFRLTFTLTYIDYIYYLYYNYPVFQIVFTLFILHIIYFLYLSYIFIFTTIYIMFIIVVRTFRR